MPRRLVPGGGGPAHRRVPRKRGARASCGAARGSRVRRGEGRRACAARRRGPALARVRELRPILRLRGARRRVRAPRPRARGGPGCRTEVSNLRNNLFFVTLALSLLGVVMVYSATYRFSGTEALVARLMHLGLGIGVFFVVSRVRYKVWRKYANVLYGVVLVALVAVL